MNAHRVAALLHELAELDERRAQLQRELAEQFNGTAPEKTTPRRPRRRERPITIHPQEASDLDVQRAMDAARRRGIM